MKENKRSAQTLWQLFKATFLLSAFTFGGGFVIVSLMKKKFVEELKWLDESEMLDITAIAQSSQSDSDQRFGHPRLPDVRYPRFSDCDSGHRPSSNDYHFGHLLFLCTIPQQPDHRDCAAGYACRCCGSHL